MKVRRALISVSDKEGLEAFVKGLDSLKIEILSTGGTAKFIAGFGIKVREVSEYTSFPEMLDGRVKTLHPKIHAGILAVRGNAEHMKKIEEEGILPIDMVVVNLYPFEKAISKKDVTFEEAIENIDIGGPAMLRSAAKNFRSVAVVSSPKQYERVFSELKAGGAGLKEETLRDLAESVFSMTARYDGCISKYLRKSAGCDAGEALPDTVEIILEKVRSLRYGENPHQRGAFYSDKVSDETGIGDARQLQGKELSFNNIVDLDAAWSMARDIKGPAVSIVKHNNPCGIAAADTLEKAYLDAIDCDRSSAFGSIMGFNGRIEAGLARVILDEVDFVECIIAPGYDKEALDIFSEKKNLRVLEMPKFSASVSGVLDIKKIPGGALVQDADEDGDISENDMKTVTAAAPDKKLLSSLLFAWKVVKHVKSNAIVLCDGTKTVGIGAGQMSRVDSVMIAVKKAGSRAKGAVLASDAFFPKADSIEEAHKAGIKAIIQPGGSIRDNEVIEACNKYGIPMIFTGVRHFKH
ncbi:MAG: bifunctional phosphoribosylaminoimidazolecarboxamide formyltransferase/IMP cyclohydrolase [Candidatus Omnitrophota bacterium]|nr:bifunctional phosphoribosylaminoimidazolecarboxamide formyltransferase/IMP cyclohydrolase [Candidatus Omnitrophota bacterium]